METTEMERNVELAKIEVPKHFDLNNDDIPGGALAQDDPPETLTGILGEQGLSRQLGLLPEQAVLKFKGTVPIHGDAEFKLGQRFECTVECVISADATKGKVEDGELVEPGKTQEATVLEARRVDGNT